MKKSFFISGAAAVIVLGAGCGPDLAQGHYGAEEQEWHNVISASYSSYRPPRIAPPATVDRATAEALAKQRASQENADKVSPVTEVPGPASDDPNARSAAQTVDKAAAPVEEQKPAAKPAEGQKPAEEAAAKPADEKDKAPAAGEEKKADAKAEKAADAESEFEIYEVKAGDTPSRIAQKFYGKASMYEVIMKANPEIKDPRQIQIGTKIKVPKL